MIVNDNHYHGSLLFHVGGLLAMLCESPNSPAKELITSNTHRISIGFSRPEGPTLISLGLVFHFVVGTGWSALEPFSDGDLWSGRPSPYEEIDSSHFQP